MPQIPEPLRQEIVKTSDALRKKEFCRQSHITTMCLWNVITNRRASKMTLRKMVQAFPALQSLIKPLVSQ